MAFDRTRLPDAVAYYEGQGVQFRERKGKWRTTACNFHGGSDSMRINTASGAFVCMAGCGARGGDVLAYHMAAYGQDFAAAAKELGAWVEGSKPTTQRPTPISPRAALEILHAEAMLAAVAAGNVAHGVVLTDADRVRLMTAAGRIARIMEVFP
ncbi:hypothetical protein GCM10027082_18750 [Comamonas humi]